MPRRPRRKPTKLLGLPIWAIVLAAINMAMVVSAVTLALLGPPSAPQSQAIGAVEVSISGLATNPIYGDLFDYDLWEVTIVSNTYTATFAMRPLIKIQGLLDCSTIELQVSSDGVSYSSVPVSGAVCQADPTSAFNKNVAAGVTGAKWFFRHRFTTNFDQFGDVLQFTAQMVQ